MASVLDNKPLHNGLCEPYTLNTDDQTTSSKPPLGAHHPRGSGQQDSADADRIYLQIDMQAAGERDSADGPGTRSSRPPRARCRCSDPKCHQPPGVHGPVRTDAFITPQARILTQRASSASNSNRLASHSTSGMSKCEAVQIVDLQVSAIDVDKEKEKHDSSLVPISSRPCSAQPIVAAGGGAGGGAVRRKKHHVMVISRDPNDASGQKKHHVLASQSLSDLVNRYPDPRPHASRPRRTPSESPERGGAGHQSSASHAADKQPPRPMSTIHSEQDGANDRDVQVKAKTTKQVRINSAVQIYDDMDLEENHRHRIGAGSGLPGHYTTDRSRSQLMNITKLRQQDYGAEAGAGYRGGGGGRLSTDTHRTTTRVGISIPDGIPQGSVVRIQHTSRGKIKVITGGSDGQYTTTILEGNRRPHGGGPRPPTRVDLMDDVLVITRKTSSSKDALVTSRPTSGNPNQRAIQSGHQQKSPHLHDPNRQRSKESSPQRQQKHAYGFKERIVAKHPNATQNGQVEPVQQQQQQHKTIELNNPYLNIADGKGEAMQRSGDAGATLIYQNAAQQQQPPPHHQHLLYQQQQQLQQHNHQTQQQQAVAPQTPLLSARQQNRWRPKESLPDNNKQDPNTTMDEPTAASNNPKKPVDQTVGKHRQYAQSRYRLQISGAGDDKGATGARPVPTFQYHSNKPPPVENVPTVEPDYASPSRHKWELEYDDYVPPNNDIVQAGEAGNTVKQPPVTPQTDKVKDDYQITDAQALYEKQYYATRHQYVRQWREQHSTAAATQADQQPPVPQEQEVNTAATNTHTVVMQAANQNPPQQNQLASDQVALPPKQQLWSKESYMQSSAGHHNGKGNSTTTVAASQNHHHHHQPGYHHQHHHAQQLQSSSPNINPYAIPSAPPRSPTRSRSRRRSASRVRRPTTPNTNLVADQLPEHDHGGAGASRKSRLASTSTELFEDRMYENFAHSKFKSKSRPNSSTRSKPQVVDRETMVKLLHMTMPKKQQDNEQF